MEREVTYQGEIALDGSTKIISTGTRLTVESISITNSTGDYVFTLRRYLEDEVLQDALVYELTLEEGDTVKDTYRYILDKGNYIQLLSDIAGSIYHVTAIAR